ncbi:UNVERIFIED_CONTAM: hypothetical protein RMT77_009088 [Armadillidium vulgare]
MDNKTYTLMPLDYEYDVNKGGFEKAIGLKKVNPRLKVTVAVGGWTEGSEKYSRMASSPKLRKTFIDSAVAFIRKNNFDGLDLDWEYPANRGGKPEDKENFVHLLREMKEAFQPYQWILTAAVGAGSSTIDTAYDIPKMSEYLDLIHMMGYDYHGKWDQETGHNAPLYARIDESPVQQTLNVNFSVHYYLSQGAPPEKFVLGLGLYGRTFLLTNSSNPGIGAPARKSAFAGPYTREDGFLGYNEICEKLLTEKWSLAWQAAHQAPYMFKDNMWVSFDDVNSLGLKVAFAQRLGLAGVMVWSMDTDDFSGQCGNRYPLLNSINRNLALHAKSRFQERVSTTRPTMRPTMRPTTQTSKQSTPWPSALPSSPSSFWPSISTTFYSSSPSSPTDYYELDKDKPDRVDIDFDTDYNNNLEDTRYYPVSGKQSDSSATNLAVSIPIMLSILLSSILCS